MHELPVTESILSIALKHAAKSSATRITDLHLVIGELATIVDESVQFYWDMVSEGSIAQGAKLHFTRVPAELQCMACFEKYHPENGELACPKCGGVGAKVLAGEEFFLESIEVDGDVA
jgi:hydrogenase nickel incorporation protein HypA/HybF